MHATAAVEDSANAVALSRHRMGSPHAVPSKVDVPLLEASAPKVTACMAPAVARSADVVASSNSVSQATACMFQLIQIEQMVMHEKDKAWDKEGMPRPLTRAVAASKQSVGSVHAVTAEAEVL